MNTAYWWRGLCASVRAERVSMNTVKRRASLFLAPVLALAAGCMLAPMFGALAQTSSETPILQLDTGGHLASIRGVAFTPDGTRLVSAGDDKVVRVWDWRNGKTISILRGQIGPGNAGKLLAMALSPDGKLVAAAGYGDEGCKERCGDVRLYELASGALKAVLRGQKSTIYALAFSPNGRWLIGGGGDSSAAIWDVEKQTLAAHLVGHRGFIYGAAFTADGERAVTASKDGDLRLWRVSDGSLITVMPGHEKMIRSLATSQRGGLIASGDDGGEIRLWDDTTGRSLKVLANQRDSVTALAFSPGGERLVSGNDKLGDRATPYKVRVWNVQSGQEELSFGEHDGAVYAVAVSADGRFVASAGGKASPIYIGELATGARVPGADGKSLSLKGSGSTVFSVGFSGDGRQIGWGTTQTSDLPNERGPLEFVLRLPQGNDRLGVPRRAAPETIGRDAFETARTHFGALSLAHRQGGEAGRPEGVLDVRRADAIIASIPVTAAGGYRYNCYSFTSDGKAAVSGGSNGVLSSYDLQSNEKSYFTGHEGDVMALAVSADGRLLVSGGSDQTVRLWNAATHELIVSLFAGDDGEWVMWTPQGYFAGSPAGEKIIGWQVNRGPDRLPDFVTGNQVRDHFYQPAIVERAIQLASAKAAIGERRGLNFALGDLTVRKPPSFEILSPATGTHLRAGSAEVGLKLDSNPDPVEAVEVLVNGRQATTPELRGTTPRWVPASAYTVGVPLEPGENRIRILARNNVGRTAQEFVLFRDGAEPAAARGSLYILAIGADRYSKLPQWCGPNGNESCDLRFAGKDAREFRDVVVKNSGPIFQDVRTLLLTSDGDKQPTKANIEDALQLFQQAGPHDTVVLFIAGHGVTESSTADYLFLPENAEPLGENWRMSTVLPWYQLENALQTSRGRRMMFVDTCHSGAAHNVRLVNNAADANIVVFSATDPETLSYEFEDIGHGAFTYAVIEGLRGKASHANGIVTVLGLGEFVSDWVSNRTEDKQQPTFAMSNTKNFALVRLENPSQPAKPAP
jgi:WD40 repeat protein